MKNQDIHQEFEELVSSSEDAKEFIHLALLGSITRRVIHETNNQLTGILGYLTLIQKSHPLPENVVSFLKRTIQCCESSQAINQTFLEFYQDKDASHSHSSNLLSEVAKFCEKIFGFPYTIQIKGLPDLPALSIPEPEFRLLLLYVLLAAKNATSNGGNIRIETAIETRTKKSANRYLTIGVSAKRSANNQSVPSDYQGIRTQSILFNELILLQIKEIADRFEGEAKAAHRENADWYYSLWLPLRKSRDNQWRNSGQMDNDTKAKVEKTLRIVHLEDQPVISDFIRTLLSEEGHFIITYANGTELAETLDGLDFSAIDLFLLDICVPGINGIEVGTLIRQKNPEARIVFYSALRNEENILEHFVIDEKTRFLQKPFKKEELFTLVKSIIAGQGVNCG